MKSHYCVICKHQGDHREYDRIETCTLYDDCGQVVKIQLCPFHSTDLFKKGQKKFLLNNYKILVDLFETDDPKFIDMLRRNFERYKDEIY